MSNLFNKYDWDYMLNEYPPQQYDIAQYHKILCSDYPVFLDKYIQLPLLQRLRGVGLLCGTDWTKLYKNRFYYSRLDHSIGVALIIWNFTKDRAQTIAGLFHDVSTPVFSHVGDFRKGDSLTQMATEEFTQTILQNDTVLLQLLEQDHLTLEQISNYHKYPIADNEIPRLSADRLEYMFPSGMALTGCWTLQEIQNIYNDITILQNSQGQQELGFNTLEIAELYCKKFCMIGHILQLNENKLTLQLLAQIMNMCEEEKILQEQDFMTLSEKQIIEKVKNSSDIKILRLINTFLNMEKIIHTNKALPQDEYFCVNLKVKQRYINPLVRINQSTYRLSEVSKDSKKIIEDFLSFSDTTYGCVKIE